MLIPPFRGLIPKTLSYEAFKQIQIGIITPSQRKSLSTIAKIVGLKQRQSLYHFISKLP